MEIFLKDIVPETYTNASGEILCKVLKVHLSTNEMIVLSFKDASITSTSFLNSSFAVLIEEMGLDEFKESVKPRDLTVTQAEVLKKYVNSFRKSDAA